MTLGPGSRLGSYEIIALVGQGGMGEVYRARDPKLQRDVAIKVLPELFARDPERLARFQREARALAALNHPSVAHIYGVEDGALVMEFVEGEDLAQRIARTGAVPLDETIPVALQIAEGLQAAHEIGIVHRDLKPANVKVRRDGTVKLLDFGLAKALAPADPSSSAGLENSPTITSPFQLSQLGVMLGTAAYMAPEQAKGKPVDRRADVWAFGCLLFEMLTGARAFPGGDVTDTLAAIIRGEPDWSRLPADTPPAIRTLLRRCLEKDRSERLPDIGAARLELRDARSASPQWPAAPAAVRRRGPIAIWFAAGAALAAAIAIAAAAWTAKTPPPARVYRSVIVPSVTLTGAPVRRLQISPDGRRLAFVAVDASGRTVLWVRPLDDTQAQPLSGTEGAAAPFWSPDGRWIAFQSEGKLKKVEASGGTVSTLGEFGGTPPGAWSRDNVILMTVSTGLVRIAATGGERVAATALGQETGEGIHLTPSFLPDGRHFLYAGARVGTTVSTIYLASLDSKASTRLLDGAQPQYANGNLLFLHGSTLMAQPFDLDRLALSGEPVPIGENIQINSATGTGAYSVAQTGELVFQTGSNVGSRLTWFDRSGKQLGSVGDAGPNADVQLSPDGKRVAVTRGSAASHPDVWLIDVAKDLPRRFTVDDAGGFAAVWDPDGRRIAYASRSTSGSSIVERAADGTGAEETLLSDAREKYPVGFAPDGKALLYFTPGGAARGRLWLLRRGERSPRQLFSPQEPDQVSGEISPDGRWIAYVAVTGDAGRNRLHVASFPDGSAKREVSTLEAATPRWRPDGKELFFTNAAKLMAVDVETTGATLETGAPHALFNVAVPATGLGLRSTYAVAAGGQKFLFNTWDDERASSPISLIVNWPATLKR